MPTQRLSAPIRAYRSEQARVRRGAVREVRRLWRGVDRDLTNWPQARAGIERVIAESQVRSAELAMGLTTVAFESAGVPVVAAEYVPVASTWAGVAGDGRPVATLLDGTAVAARRATASGLSALEVQRAASAWLTMATVTVLADTMRGVEQMDMQARKVTWYSRALGGSNPCGRCIILAGTLWSSSEAFERHPNCQCSNIPFVEGAGVDPRVDYGAYLDSLDDEQLARALGSRANAQAYKDGASAQEMVNAYRKAGSVRKAQIYGRDVKVTFEGTTRHGRYGRLARARGGDFSKQQGRSRAVEARLMPSSIYEIAESRAQAIEMLRHFGWIY